jgi:ParB-like chromosome segregation protein Spo0J
MEKKMSKKKPAAPAKLHPSLKAMAEDKSLEGVGKITNFAVDPRILEIEDGFNGRPIDKDHVRAMANGYHNGATFPPLDVRVEDGRVIVVDGHHRREAALLAISEGCELQAVECRHFRGNDIDRIMLMVTSQQGLPMTPLQLGVQYKKLLGLGWTAQQIAGRAGKSGQHVKDCIALAETNSDVQQLVTAGKVSAKVALTTAKKHGSKAGEVLQADLKNAAAAGKSKVTQKTASVKTVRMSLLDAIRREIDTNGAEKAHVLAPQYEREIQYLRATGL